MILKDMVVWHGRCKVMGKRITGYASTMAKIQEKICEVIGWLLDEEDNSQVLVRERDGQISLQTASLDSTFGRHAIQTGCFRRGKPIIDPVTHETLGYEMVSVENPLAGISTI